MLHDQFFSPTLDTKDPTPGAKRYPLLLVSTFVECGVDQQLNKMPRTNEVLPGRSAYKNEDDATSAVNSRPEYRVTSPEFFATQRSALLTPQLNGAYRDYSAVVSNCWISSPESASCSAWRPSFICCWLVVPVNGSIPICMANRKTICAGLVPNRLAIV
jgi:hypothetical protein